MGKITVIGVGFSEDQLTLGAARLLESGVKVIMHTARCGAADFLDKAGVPWTSLDELYDEIEDFDEHATAAAEAVRCAASECDVAYCVIDIRDESAGLLIASGAEVIPGTSAEGALIAMCREGVMCWAASDWEDMRPLSEYSALVREIDSRELACEVKLRLSVVYPDDAQALFICEGKRTPINLYDLDRQDKYDHTCAVMVYAVREIDRKNACTMGDLESLARNSKAYASGDFDELCRDIIRFAGQCAYAEDHGEFTADDVVTAACQDIAGN